TALKELYAFLDTFEVDNDGHTIDHFREKNRDLSIIVEAAQGPIPIEQTLDPTSPNYMHWYDPDLPNEDPNPVCRQDPVHLRISALSIHYLLLGSIDSRKLANNYFCVGFGGTSKAPQFAASDFNDWTMVTLRAPNPGEDRTLFYDLPKLRTATELVVTLPRY